jgi:uncharacterized protein YegP (UPF0339 family)
MGTNEPLEVEGPMYFVITHDRDGYRARAYGRNNELVWWTEAYVSKAGALNAIHLIQSAAATAPIYDQT